MPHTFTLLTAALLAGQTADSNITSNGKNCPCQKNGPVGTLHAIPAETTARRGLFSSISEDRPILSRIQNLFGRRQETEIQAQTIQTPIITEAPTDRNGVRLMQRLPAGRPNETVPAIPVSQPASNVKIVTPTTYQSPAINQAPAIAPAKVTSSAAGTTLNLTAVPPPSRPNRISPELVNKVGHAEDYSWITGQVRIENGAAVLHYATPEVVDRYQGHIILAADRDLRGLADGAYVCARGQVTTQQGRNIYRAQSVDVLPTK